MNAQQTNEELVAKILELAKLKNTIKDISEEVNKPYKEVVNILLEQNTKTIIGLKQSTTKHLKKIVDAKTISEREKLVEEVNKYINTIYDNFKWIIDNFINNCPDYFNVDELGKSIDKPTEEEMEKLIKVIKRDDTAVEIIVGLNLEINTIIQHIVHINKIRKATISKRLSKIISKIQKDKRKLIALDIEDVVDEMYSLYKWIIRDYTFCIENKKIMNEIENELNNKA